MPPKPAQPAKKRTIFKVEVHPDVHKYIQDLSDDVGVQAAYILRLCVQDSLPKIEALLRSGEEPHDELKRPTAPLKTTLSRPKQIPDVSRQPAPPIAEFLETGEMPAFLHTLPGFAEPGPTPEPRDPWQVPDAPAETAAPPVSPTTSAPTDADPVSSPPQPPAAPPRRRRRG